ncbi:hypothetical protein SAMN04487901_1314, partial [Prevotella communis]
QTSDFRLQTSDIFHRSETLTRPLLYLCDKKKTTEKLYNKK